MCKLPIILFISVSLFSCQTQPSQQQDARKKSPQRQRQQSSEKIVGNNEAHSLSKGWDSGLLEFGDKERSRQALDLH